MRQSKALISFLFLSMFFFSCSPFKKSFIKNHIQFTDDIYQSHTGFVLYDLETKTYLYQHQANKYFTPSSNTKIFTFYTGLMLLGETVPALQYSINGDSLIFWGTGDPSFLNNNVAIDTKVMDFLQSTDKTLYYSSSHYDNPHLGPGWAWDDYQYTFSAERSPFPIYGNTFMVGKSDNMNRLKINVPYFKRYFYLGDSSANAQTIQRKLDNNEINYTPKNEGFTKGVPFHYSDHLVTQLLSDTLKREVIRIDKDKPRNAKTVYSVPTDSLYKVMMQDSDNFIAEQLLLTAGSTITDNLNTKQVIDYMLETYLYDMPDQPIWKDGSGLSRYNLFTPRTMVALWEKIYHELDRERLFGLLSANGESGTLKNYYKSDEPYIYAKTGTLSNNHCLSGFLVTSKGKVLIFSYMNNNYPVSGREIKNSMERLLQEIRLKF